MLTSPQPSRLSCDSRRSQLLQAAIRVFARKGFQGTRTREIAAEAGVNEALVFRHFPTKDDLYAAILEEKAGEDWAGSIVRALEEPAQRRDDQAYFHTFAAKFLDCLTSNPEFLRLMLFSALENHESAREYRRKHVQPLYQAVARYIALRQKEGALRAMRPHVAMRAFAGMLANYVLSTEIYGDVTPRITQTEAASAFTSLFLSGLNLK